MAQQGMSSPYADGSMTAMFTEVVNRMGSTGEPNPNKQHIAVQPTTPPIVVNKEPIVVKKDQFYVQEDLPFQQPLVNALSQSQKTKLVQFIISSGAALTTVSETNVKFKIPDISEELMISLV